MAFAYKETMGASAAPPDCHESCIFRWIFSHGLVELYCYMLLFANP